MAGCDMCGKESELFVAEVEGTQMTVCKVCASFGKIVKKVIPKEVIEKRRARQAAEAEREPELIQMVVPDYSKIVRNQREKLGLTQKNFARLIKEKESVVSSIETGKHDISISLAEKLEHMLKIKLIEEVPDARPPAAKPAESAGEAGEYTLGDFIKKR